MAYHHQLADLLPGGQPTRHEGALPAYLLAMLEEQDPLLPEQESLQALTEMTPGREQGLPELPPDYFLCHPDHEPQRWRSESLILNRH